MRSMTGFGTGDCPIRHADGDGRGRIGVEVRAVNHRYLDVRVRVPRELGDLASFVEQLARERFMRGRYEVAVRVDGLTLGAAVLDLERAKAAYRDLCELRDEVAPGAEVPLSLLGAVPDLFVSSVERESDALRAAIRGAFERALVSLDEMREREGHLLAEDLMRRLDTLRALARLVTERAPEILDGHRQRLRDRTERLRTEVTWDDGRLEQEIALFAERVDITEELTRLESHCSQFQALLATPSTPCGRRLDFLLQEMVREANTAGAKSADALIVHAVVEMKAELERMREQVQNVE
jgi:uncharacterized protein (TIGR00255 family)